MFLDTIPDHQQHAIELHNVRFSLDINSQDADAMEQQQAEELGEPIVAHAIPAGVLAGD